MLLGGLWHGAAWTFVMWGLYQGLLLILYRPLEPAIAALTRPGRAAAAARFGAWVLMFHLTCYGWLIFRAPSFLKLRELTGHLFMGFAPSTADVSGLLVPLLVYTSPLLVVHLLEARVDDVLAVPRLHVGLRYTIYVATLYLILLFGNFGGSDFIYFQF
jgi:D-alanyl-lipoteichoic acid acyltransferase DltB (MBOAT superfamily)